MRFLVLVLCSVGFLAALCLALLDFISGEDAMALFYIVTAVGVLSLGLSVSEEAHADRL